MSDLTQARLKDLLHYNFETGVFVWLATGKGRKLNCTAGGLDTYGYCRIKVKGKYYKAHRLAWLYTSGVWPKDQIDHINGNRSDNRISNLREATNTQNNQNQINAQVNSKSGILGISRSGSRWQAKIGVDKKYLCLGSYKTPEEAHAAYIQAKRDLHEFCAI